MSGGQTGLLASVLDAQSPSDLARRIGTLRRVVDADRRATERRLTQPRRCGPGQTERVQLARCDAPRPPSVASEDRLRELTDLLDEAQASP